MSDVADRPEVSYFNKKSAEYRAEYDRETPEGYSFRVRREKVLTLVPDGTNVVDIASGPGVMIPGLRKKNCRITCTDAAPEMIERTKEEYGLPAEASAQAGDAPDIRAVVGDAYALPFERGEFDVATAMGLIEYLEHEGKFLGEASRILKEKGLLIVTFPNYWSPWRMTNRLALDVIRLARKLLGREKFGPVTHREYTARRARELLAKHGFTPERTVYYNFKLVPYPFDVKLPRLTVAQSKLFEYLDRTPLRFFGTGFIVSAKKK